MLGYIFAIISSLFFSLYVVPRKLSKLSALEFSLLMSVGFFVSSVLLYCFQPILKFHETPSLALLWSLLAGAIWAASFVALVKAIDAIGLSRSNQWKNLQGPVAAILSLLLLNEVSTTKPGLVLLAGATIFVSALCFTIASSKEQAKLHLSGVYLAALSALGFGSVAVIQKHVTSEVGVYSQQVVWSFAIMLSLTLYLLVTRRKLLSSKPSKQDAQLGLGAGMLYLGACFFQLKSYQYLPASIAFSIIQLNTIWTIAIGILVFKEISARKHYVRLTIGLIFAMIGISLLAIARK